METCDMAEHYAEIERERERERERVFSAPAGVTPSEFREDV